MIYLILGAVVGWLLGDLLSALWPLAVDAWDEHGPGSAERKRRARAICTLIVNQAFARAR